MSPVAAAVIRRKLGVLSAAIDALGPLSRLSLVEYRARLYERKAAERLLQEAVEAALDVNAQVIAELSSNVPDDSYRLVHEYDDIDDAKVKDAIGTLLRVYPRYVQAIEAHLTKTGL